jgi:hypothetical protein
MRKKFMQTNLCPQVKYASHWENLYRVQVDSTKSHNKFTNHTNSSVSKTLAPNGKDYLYK